MPVYGLHHTKMVYRGFQRLNMHICVYLWFLCHIVQDQFCLWKTKQNKKKPQTKQISQNQPNKLNLIHIFVSGL